MPVIEVKGFFRSIEFKVAKIFRIGGHFVDWQMI